MAIEPEKGVTTHPEVVRASVNSLKEINAEIIIGDGPSVWGGQVDNIEDVFNRDKKAMDELRKRVEELEEKK